MASEVAAETSARKAESGLERSIPGESNSVTVPRSRRRIRSLSRIVFSLWAIVTTVQREKH